MRLSRGFSASRSTAIAISATVIMAAASLLTSTPARTAPIVHNCGVPISSIVRTEIGLFSTQSTTFANVTGAAVAITVPAGTTRCVKVRFSGIMRCSETVNFDVCAILVVIPNLVTFDPAFLGIDYHDEDSNYAANSYEFVKRLDPGSYTIRVRAGVQNAATKFDITAWTMDVEIDK